MPLVQQSDHEAQGLERVITPLFEKPIFSAWLASYLNQVQEVEDALFQLLEERWPDTATSTEIFDLLGRVVGQRRDGRNNADFLLWIKARILLNRSSGTPEEMLAIALLASGLLDGSLILEEVYPAALTIEIPTVFPGTLGDQVSGILHLAESAGVAFYLIWFVDEDSFTFSDTDDTETDADKGFGDDTLTDPGGLFSSAR